MKHAHTHTPTSPSGVRQRPRLKVISSEACTPGEEPKVERGRMDVVDTFLIGAKVAQQKREGQRGKLSVATRPDRERAESWFICAQLLGAE